MKTHPVLNKTKEQLYQQIIQNQTTSGLSVEARTALLEWMFTDLSSSNDKLAGRVFWLNVAIGAATCVGATFTVLQFFK